MKEIKTKSTIKDIKALDKTADVSRRAKNAFIRTKEQAEQTQRPEYDSFVEYAEDKVKEGTETVSREAGHAVEHQGKKAVQKIKERRSTGTDTNYTDAADGYTAEQTSHPENGNPQTGNRSAASSKGKQTASSKAGKAPEQYNAPMQAKQSAQQKAAQSKAKETVKQKYTLFKPNELAKRRFVQSRAKQRLSQNREMQAAGTKPIQTAQNPMFRHAEKTTWRTAQPNISGAGRTIKQSAQSGNKAVKETAKGTIKTAQKSVKTARQTAKAAIKTSQAAAKTAAKTAQATQRAAQAAQAAARAAAVSAKTAVKAMVATIKAIILAVKGLIAAGGWVAVVVILVICLAGLLLGSAFGIFFSNESSGENTPVMTEVVRQLNGEFTAKIERIQDENPHDTQDLSNNGSSTIVSNWREILAVYAVKVAADPGNGMEVATLDDTKVGILRDIFWDMNKIDYWIETIEHEETVTTTDEDGNETKETVTTTEIILHINVTSKSHADMIAEYGFNSVQVKMLNELMQDEYQQLFMRLTGSYMDIVLSPQEIADIMKNLPDDLDELRKGTVLAAYSLVGKVNYFWGGKSTVIGWDTRWGTLTKVTAEGSPTTGTVRSFGLDCSGYVVWAYVNAKGSADTVNIIRDGASSQYAACTPVHWSQAQPGDLAFYSDLSHVGIVVGRESGNLLIANCSFNQNNVVVFSVSGASALSFYMIGRPQFYE